ncbi:phosphate uptake regulator PhoU [Candidatus Woesearchaeota archaeon]|nr:phosphate uptake regulator PhoU [Candidatus Woesearchaeota archaeon]
MKRKVIQIAGSTQLVSLPRQWAIRNNVKRGQEIDVQEDGSKVVITADNVPVLERAELDISDLGEMIPRCIRSLYKRGVDELRITFNKPEMATIIQSSITKEAIGFEILEQGQNFCLVKYVSGGVIEDFDSLLRRIFLLLVNMADDSVSVFKKGNYDHLKNVALLEEANNRFTIICRRALNKKNSAFNFKKLGPLYYIVEELEHIADQYKYICHHFANLSSTQTKLNKDVIDLFESSSKLLRLYYELFYKFDTAKIVALKNERNRVIDEAHDLFKRKLTYADYWMIHHSIDITNRVFCMLGPYMVLAL